MSNRNPSAEERLEPLDLNYARFMVKHSPGLERIAHARSHLPKELLELFRSQSTDYLYGVATAIQSIHDLGAKEVLAEVARVLGDEDEKENARALNMAMGAAQLVSLMEALGLFACEEIVRRADEAGVD